MNRHASGTDQKRIGPQNGRVWRRREPALDRETVDGIIRMPMGMDEELDRIVEGLELGEDDGEEEMDA